MLDVKARQIGSHLLLPLLPPVRRPVECLSKLLKGVGVEDGGASRKGFTTSESETIAYKVLILDARSRDIVAPLMKINHLRALGVTLHLSIESERQSIEEVPAVYLVQATAQNIERIAKDLAGHLYGEYYLSFISRISRPLLESLAQRAVQGNAAQSVARIEDQYMSFISLEKGLFSLGLSNVYSQLNNPRAKDTDINATVEQIVDGLFCVFVTLAAIPVIKCPAGGSAEHICSALDERIRTELKTRTNLFSEATAGLLSSLARPLLVLFDRNFDLSGALQHSWSYKPLVQDALHLRLNRVAVATKPDGDDAASSGQETKTTNYDLDEEDFFWQKCGAYSFPKIAEEVEAQLQNYKVAVEEINKKTVKPTDASSSEDKGSLDTENLMAAVSSLPELTERKKVLDKHTGIATALLSVIKERALDQYFNLEEDTIAGKADFATMLKQLQASKGSSNDKLRLACVYLLAASPLPSETETNSILQALGGTGLACDIFSYVRTLCINKLAGVPHQSSSGLSNVVHGPSEGTLLSWAEKNFSQGLSSVSKSVRNLLSGAKRSPVVAAIEALTEGKAESGSGIESFRTFDPKSPHSRSMNASSMGSKEVMVFMVGGGNYLERESLELWATSQTKVKQVVYGATEMLSSDEFISELATLARK